MEPDAVTIEIASKQFENYKLESLKKILVYLENNLTYAERPGSYTGSGRVFELKTEIAAIKKLLRRMNR